jgi:hypothetical protein
VSATADTDELDFEQIEALVSALLDHAWPGAANLREDASNGEAIGNYVASLSASDRDLLLREYLVLEVMLDEVGGPSVANAVNTYLPPLPNEPSV